jgi:ATP-dependent RNA helicase RhlE
LTQFSTLGLAAEILRAIEEQGYTEATPIQAQAIPPIIEGRDVFAAAQTGTGKTAGFTLPMLHRLSLHSQAGPMNRPLRALILTPTRELAAQVNESVRTYGKHLKLKSTMICGGLGMRPQVEALRRGVDILVATPGRLLDHMQQKTVNLSAVEFLVLDEADRMLDMGFINDMRRVMQALPKQRQSLLFSATFSDEIRGLASSFLRDPLTIEVARRNLESELVTQRVYTVDQARKRELLTKLVAEGNWQQVLVFTRTKHGANRLAEQLQKSGIEADAIHGNKSQNARTRALADFKRGAVRVLVGTDLAARGLDIQELPHVVNYEMPNVPEDYVHRIGRTGRAGSSGEAISLVCKEEEPLIRDIERVLKRKLLREVVKGFERGSAPGAQIIVPADDVARPARSRPSAAEAAHDERPKRAARPKRNDSAPRARTSDNAPRARTSSGAVPAHRRAEGGARPSGKGRGAGGGRDGNRSLADRPVNRDGPEIDGNRIPAARSEAAEVDGNRAAPPRPDRAPREPNGNRRPAGGGQEWQNHPPKPAGARGPRGPAGAKPAQARGEAKGNRADATRRTNNGPKRQGDSDTRTSAGYGLQSSWRKKAA